MNRMLAGSQANVPVERLSMRLSGQCDVLRAVRGILSNAGLARSATGPATWIARVMNDGQDVNKIISNRIGYAVRKSWKQGTPNARHRFRVEQRSLLKPFELQIDRGDELFAKFRASRFVPAIRLARLAQCARGETSCGLPRAVSQVRFHLLPRESGLGIRFELFEPRLKLRPQLRRNL